MRIGSLTSRSLPLVAVFWSNLFCTLQARSSQPCAFALVQRHVLRKRRLIDLLARPPSSLRRSLVVVRSKSSSSSSVGTTTTTTTPPETSNKNVDLTPIAFGGAPDPLPMLDEDEKFLSSSSQQLPLFQLALAGSLATLVSDMTMHPIDCIKTVLQSDQHIGWTVLEATNYLYHSAGGLAAFYSGFLTYAVTDALGGALKFSVWELWKERTKDKQPTVLYLWCGAALAFLASSVLIVPGELIKQQLQMSYYDGLPEAVQGIFQSAGLSGFYVGYEGVLYRDIPYTMLELGLYEIFKKALDDFKRGRRQKSSSSSSSSQEPWEEIVAAAATGGITAFLTTPLDTIKTKLMVDDDYAGVSFVECLVTTVHNHGWSSAFAGVVARIAWILPFTALYLPTYDFLKRQLWKLSSLATTTTTTTSSAQSTTTTTTTSDESESSTTSSTTTTPVQQKSD